MCRIPVVVFGRALSPNPADLVEATLAFSPSPSMVVYDGDLDGDFDGVDDVMIDFDIADLELSSSADRIHFHGKTAEGRRVLEMFQIVREAVVSDDDGDGLHNGCDACPSVSSSTVDGCP